MWHLSYFKSNTMKLQVHGRSSSRCRALGSHRYWMWVARTRVIAGRPWTALRWSKAARWGRQGGPVSWSQDVAIWGEWGQGDPRGGGGFHRDVCGCALVLVQTHDPTNVSVFGLNLYSVGMTHSPASSFLLLLLLFSAASVLSHQYPHALCHRASPCDPDYLPAIARNTVGWKLFLSVKSTDSSTLKYYTNTWTSAGTISRHFSQ